MRRITLFFLALFTLGSVLAACGCLFFLAQHGFFKDETKLLSMLKHHETPTRTLILDRSNIQIDQVFTKFQIPIKMENLPSHFVHAIVSIEDKNFYGHSGIDPLAFIRASVFYLKTKMLKQNVLTPGASTITQQLVRHFFLSKEKKISRKIRELNLALQLEGLFSKEDILVKYLNTMYLGNHCYGVEAAARKYFSKSVHALTVEESALIAGLFQLPSYFNPKRHPARAKKRQQTVLKAMLRNGYLDNSTFEELFHKKVAYSFSKDSRVADYGHFTDMVKKNVLSMDFSADNRNKTFDLGLKVHTTLDSQLQKAAIAAIQKQHLALQELESSIITKSEKNRRIEAALLAVDVSSGEILAMVGSRNFAENQFNHATQSKRSPGSLFKTYVVSKALKESLSWNKLFFVMPYGSKDYRPKSSSRDYMTETTLARAYYLSMNAPMLNLAEKIGIKNIIDHAKSLGVKSAIKREIGSAIGGSDLTFNDLIRSYMPYATSGLNQELTSIRSITNRNNQTLYKSEPSPSNQVLDPATAALTRNGMRQVLLRGTGAGYGHLAAQGVYGKTGTSNKNKDNWFLGFNSQVMTLVWVGTNAPEGIPGNLGGGKLALPIFSDFMETAGRLYPPRKIENPPEVVEIKVDPYTGKTDEDGIVMSFLSGTEPKESNDSSTLRWVKGVGKGKYRELYELE